LRRSRAIESTSPASRAQSETSWPRSAHRIARQLPKLPAPQGDEKELLVELQHYDVGTSRLSCQVDFTDSLDGLELKIAPSGGVVEVRVVSTELKASELEAKLLARIRQFDFGSKDVEQMVVSWPVDFLPS